MNATGNEPGTMSDLIRWNIKEVIAAYPPVGDILGQAGIGCVGCSVGTCLLKDVISIHNLSEAQEQALFASIAAVVFPDQNPVIPRTERKKAPSSGIVAFSPPMQELVNEHVSIKRVLALIPKVGESLADGLDDARRQTIADMLDFIRNFADRYHHAKEEELLFKYFDPTAEILVVMHAEHEQGRGFVRAAADALAQGDAGTVRAYLLAYGQLLAEHIRKEDEILYPWMDRQLSDTQVGKLFGQFRDVDRSFGDKPARYRALVDELERRIR